MDDVFPFFYFQVDGSEFYIETFISIRCMEYFVPDYTRHINLLSVLLKKHLSADLSLNFQGVFYYFYILCNKTKRIDNFMLLSYGLVINIIYNFSLVSYFLQTLFSFLRSTIKIQHRSSLGRSQHAQKAYTNSLSLFLSLPLTIHNTFTQNLPLQEFLCGIMSAPSLQM